MNPNKKMSPLAANGLAALRQAVTKVEEEHRRQGTPMAVWHDGKVVLEIPKPIDSFREKEGEYSDNTDDSDR